MFRLLGKYLNLSTAHGVTEVALGDAADPKFKPFQAILKEEKTGTKERLEKLQL
jgi:hypothetical protein